MGSLPEDKATTKTVMNSNHRTIAAISIFCIAMAALESAVVVYLRALYYPDGFTVMLKMIDPKIVLIEIVREAATVVMLIAVAYLTGNSFKNRFAYFLMAFAIWDIFYYVWLKIFIDWPSSLFEWDILFLIPFTWLGPVLAPLICSLLMLLLSWVIMKTDKPLAKVTWALLTIGAAFILYTFLYDYARIIIGNDLIQDYLSILKNEKFIRIASHYVPAGYNWGIFVMGFLFISLSVGKQFAENNKTTAASGH